MNIIFKKNILFFSVFLNLLFAGCATTPFNFDSKEVVAQAPFKYELEKISVVFSKPIDIDPIYQTNILQSWKDSLQKSLSNGNFFEAPSEKKLEIVVNILDLEPGPVAFESKIKAEYKIILEKDSKILFSETISSESKDKTLLGTRRVIRLLNKSISANIENFLTSLSLSKF